MIPILYDAAETQFKTNGAGMLSDAISCEVIQTLNGEYELEMVYPARGLHFSQIQQRSIILAKPDPVTDPQPFRVYRITKPMNGKVTVYARHIAYDMMGIPVATFSAEGVVAALAAMKSNAVEDCPFTFSTDMIADNTMTVKKPMAMWELLGDAEGSILNTFGGEYEFDRWDVRLHNRRGMNRGVSIRYGKNLTDLKQEENCAGCYTGVYPYWANAEGDYLELPERKVYAKGNFGYSRILTMDFSSEWTEKPTVEQLRAKTESYIADNDIGVPQVSWKVEFVQLEQTEEYRGKALLERVILGDTVAVEFSEMGISATARANEVRYLPILERYKSITLGSIRSGFADIIVNQGKELEKRPNRTYMENAISLLTNALLGARGGAVRFLDTDGDEMPDTLYIADNADPGQAKKVWRFNYEGWAASKTGYDGPFVMGASFDSGILAEFITAGTLYGMLLKAGKIESEDGKIVIDLTDGAEPMFNGGLSVNALRIRSDAAGMDNLFRIYTAEHDGEAYPNIQMRYPNNKQWISLSEAASSGGTISGCALSIFSPNGNGHVYVLVSDNSVNIIHQNAKADVDARIILSDSNQGFYLQKKSDNQFAGYLIYEGGKAKLKADQINGKDISWKYNDDGTYTMTGM